MQLEMSIKWSRIAGDEGKLKCVVSLGNGLTEREQRRKQPKTGDWHLLTNERRGENVAREKNANKQ